MVFDRGWKAAREREIKADFKPRSWEQLGRQAIAAADRIAEKAGRGPILPEAFVNRYYPIRLQRRPQVWKGLGSGEIFRIGNGWSWQIGRASCRERGCQYVEISVVAVTFKQKTAE